MVWDNLTSTNLIKNARIVTMLSHNRAALIGFATNAGHDAVINPDKACTSPRIDHRVAAFDVSAVVLASRSSVTIGLLERVMRHLFFATVMAAVALPASAQTISGATFVAKAGASDMFERESSKLLTGSANAKVRDFAAMMIADHTKSTADVKAAASTAGLKVAPPKLEPMQAKDLAALRAVRGPARDRLYIAQQKKAHAAALALHTDYAASGTVAPLKAVASTIAPTVKHHKSIVDGM